MMEEKLIFDIMNGDTQGVKDKIEKQKELLESKDKFGRTLLMEAAINAKVDIARFLIDEGIDVNAQEKNGWTALHFAVDSSSIELIGLLLDKKAKIDIQDNNGNTPLMNAVVSSQKPGDIIPMLLNAGADRNKKNEDGNSPLNLAEQITNLDLLQYFKS